ncbi:hypothetical protein L484_023948 [Morus notabilis]|uniref:Uncharacterized protein n=1 Tax=Morus notabilis TaxID=981085 RepID=W9RB20_9ROSA|nr:hypothetical protein L484_023948 [Morus notabilis]
MVLIYEPNELLNSGQREEEPNKPKWASVDQDTWRDFVGQEEIVGDRWQVACADRIWATPWSAGNERERESGVHMQDLGRW